MLYEGVIVYDSALSDSDVAAQLDKVEAIITGHSGQVTKRDVWGRRQLAYKIKKKEFGIYTFLVFSGASSLVADLRRQLRINDSVVRFLVVKKDKFAPDLIRPPTSDSYGQREGGYGQREGGYGQREGGFRDNYREPFYGGGQGRDGGDRDGGLDADIPQGDGEGAA